LLAAREYGVNFSDAATLGRQSFIAEEYSFRRVVEAFRLPQNAAEVIRACGRSGDKYLELLGAQSVTSFDTSDYEKATVVHDMNQPLPKEYRGRFSAVFDGGTMEHVFNATQFYKNALDMVRPGGHYLCGTCGNNLLGHGFYQFSPEFFYQTLTPENGFDDAVVMLSVFEDAPPPFYAVAKPRQVRGRVELLNCRPLYIFAIARRTERKPLFAQTPQQSDYVVAWQQDPTAPGDYVAPPPPRPQPQWKTKLKRSVPQSVRPVVKRWLSKRRDGGLRQSCFKRLSLADLARGELRHPINVSNKTE
jgi:hypothetical protein